jgi:hypothetical protein
MNKKKLYWFLQKQYIYYWISNGKDYETPPNIYIYITEKLSIIAMIYVTGPRRRHIQETKKRYFTNNWGSS